MPGIISIRRAAVAAVLANAAWHGVAEAGCETPTLPETGKSGSSAAQSLESGTLVTVEVDSGAPKTLAEATEIYKSVVTAPDSDPLAVGRAKYQLARVLKRERSFTRAALLARELADETPDPKLKRKALALYAQTAYNLNVESAEKGLSNARSLRKAGRLIEARETLTQLAALQCPYKDDFKDRVVLETARLDLDDDQLAPARLSVANLLQTSSVAGVRSGAIALLARIDRAARDADAKQAVAAASDLADQGSLNAALKALAAIRAEYAAADSNVLASALFEQASILRAQGKPDEARAAIRLAGEGALFNPSLRARVQKELFKHDVEMAAQAAETGDAARALADLAALEERAPDAPSRLRAVAARAQILAGLGQYETARLELTSAAIPGETDALSADASLKLAVSSANARASTTGVDAALKEIRTAIAAGQASRKAKFEARVTAAALLAGADRPEAARAMLAEAGALNASEAGYAELRIAMAVAKARRADGDLTAADDSLTAALPKAASAPARVAAQAVALLAAIRAERLDAAAGRQLAEGLLASEDVRVRAMASEALLNVDLAAVRKLENAGRYEEARSELEAVLARNGAAPADALLEARLLKVDLYADAGEFGQARANLEQLASLSGDLSAQKPVSRARSKLVKRESEYNAKLRVEQARALATGGDLGGALLALSLVASDSKTPTRWRDEAKVRRIDLLLGEQLYADARNELIQIKAMGVEPAVQPRLLEAEDELSEATASNRLSGFLALGTGYDTNAPARRSGARLEDESSPYPLDQDLEDFSFRALGQGVLRHGFGENASHLRAALGFEAIKQSDLTQLDSLRVSAEAGPVFQLPKSRTFVAATAIYNREWRGGDFFGEEVGAKLSVQSEAFKKKEVFASIEAVTRDDARNESDGGYYEADAGITRIGPTGGRLTLELNVQRAETDQDYFRYWGPALQVAYVQKVGEWKGMPIKAGASARARYLDFDGLTPTVNGPMEREDKRYRGNLGISINPTPDWSLSAEYEYFKQTSNTPGRTRDDHFIGLTVKRTFGGS